MGKERFHLKRSQIKKLIEGGSIIVRPEHLGGKYELHLKDHKHHTLLKKLSTGKGAKLSLDKEEIEASGFTDWIKKTASKAYKGYKKYVAPVVRRNIKRASTAAISTGIPLGMDFLGLGPEYSVAAPFITQGAVNLAHKGIDWFGDTTGAYGLPKPSLRGHRGN